MPIYEYQCSKCGHRMEALQKISDAPLTECPACHEQGLTKLVSAASFRLKGGGWYETDFKTEGRKQLAESDSKPEASASDKATAASTTGGKESKPSAKSDSGKAAETAAKKTTADTAKKS